MGKQKPKPAPSNNDIDERLSQIGPPLTNEELKELCEIAVKLRLVEPNQL